MCSLVCIYFYSIVKMPDYSKPSTAEYQEFADQEYDYDTEEYEPEEDYDEQEDENDGQEIYRCN